MKITLTHYDETVSIETEHDDLTTAEALEKVSRLLILAGYAERSVKQAVFNYADKLWSDE